MKHYRKTAILVGLLFIVGTAAGVMSVVLTQPLLDAPDYLRAIAAHENRVVVATLCVLTMGLSLAMVPVLLYPLLKQYDHVLALGYVVFRGALETFTYLGIAISWLLLIGVSQAYTSAVGPNLSTLETLGGLLHHAGEMSAIMTALLFPLGALMLYIVLFRSQLIPRWLSVWGIAAVILHMFATGFLGIFGRVDHMAPSQFILNFPIFLQEMVMAVWLIVKGFSPAVTPARSARVAFRS